MAEYLSAYTGQEIDERLRSVDDKINKTDIVDDLDVADSESPASSRLTNELKNSVDQINQDLGDKVVRADGGEQTVSGRKKFGSVIDANAGINVPTGKSITIADEPVNATDAVNLSMLRKHGVSEDSTPTGSGLKISLLPNGYNQLALDIASLASYTNSAAPTHIPVVAGTATYKWSMTLFLNLIFADSRFSGYLKVSDYDADMVDIQNQFNTVNTTLGQKVNTSTYNTKMSALDTSISNLSTNKVETSTYNTKMTALDTAIAGKVDTTTYTSKMTDVDNALAARVTLGKTNASAISVAASGNTALPDFTMANLCQVLLTAKWGTLVDTYRVTITYDGTIKTELLTQKSTAGTVSFAGSVVSGKLRLTITNANTTTACSVDYNLVASF